MDNTDMNVVRSVNAPVSVLQRFKLLAQASFGDSTKQQYLFRTALSEFLDNHKKEHDVVISKYIDKRQRIAS